MDQSPYYRKIRQWQHQIQAEGWSAALVDKVVKQARCLTHYEMDFEDDWLTPKAFIQAGFRGDCEDIAIFLMGTLKRLSYPYKVRVLVIEDFFADHAQLKVEMPDRRWKFYESTRNGAYSARPAAWKPIVEFDENTIIYHASSEKSRTASIR